MPVEHVTNLADFQTILTTSGPRLVVVDFHAAWCGPCHAIAPLYEKLSNTYSSRGRFLKVDVDEAEDIARKCSVSAMPTFHFYVNGRRVSDFSGADPRKLQATIEKHAPSADDVAFMGSGTRLGSNSSTAEAGPKVDWSVQDRRAAAAEAAAKRSQKKRAEDDGGEKKVEEGSSSDDTNNDSRLKVNQSYLKQMVEELGFPKIRAEKALILTGNRGIEPAMEWCFAHEDDPDVDEPLQVVTKEGSLKPKLSKEEAKAKADELYKRARERREAEEKKEKIEREKYRIKSGKEMTATKAQLEDDSRKRAIEERKQEKREAKLQRERVKAMLEADKQRRKEKFNMPGAPKVPHPVENPAKSPSAPSNPSAARGKIQFRLPDGSRIEGKFDGEQTMGDLITFLVEAKPDLSAQRLKLAQQYPRKVFSESDYGVTLADLKLLPRGALTVSFS